MLSLSHLILIIERDLNIISLTTASHVLNHLQLHDFTDMYRYILKIMKLVIILKQESIYQINDKIVRQLVMEDQEDELEFIRLPTMTEFLVLSLVKMLYRISILHGRMWVIEILEGHM